MEKADLHEGEHCLLLHNPGFPNDVTFISLVGKKGMDCSHMSKLFVFHFRRGHSKER